MAGFVNKNKNNWIGQLETTIQRNTQGLISVSLSSVSTDFEQFLIYSIYFELFRKIFLLKNQEVEWPRVPEVGKNFDVHFLNYDERRSNKKLRFHQMKIVCTGTGLFWNLNVNGEIWRTTPNMKNEYNTFIEVNICLHNQKWYQSL